MLHPAIRRQASASTSRPTAERPGRPSAATRTSRTGPCGRSRSTQRCDRQHDLRCQRPRRARDFLHDRRCGLADSRRARDRRVEVDDGGATFTLLQHSTVVLGALPGQTFESTFGSTRGATDVAVDPTHAGVIYATAYNKGVWRSTDNGATWTSSTRTRSARQPTAPSSRSRRRLTATPACTRVTATRARCPAIHRKRARRCTAGSSWQMRWSRALRRSP